MLPSNEKNLRLSKIPLAASPAFSLELFSTQSLLGGFVVQLGCET